LKAWDSRVELGRNALLGSRLVLAQTERGADEDSRVDTLRDQICAALDQLAQSPEPGACHAHILQRTYITAADNQKRVAVALGMGYSTYRRRLAAARQAFA